MGYKQLQIYERSYKAALAIYQLTKGFPETEKFALTSQMQRASTSIALNIAEGYAKKSSQEYDEIGKMLNRFIQSVNKA